MRDWRIRKAGTTPTARVWMIQSRQSSCRSYSPFLVGTRALQTIITLVICVAVAYTGHVLFVWNQSYTELIPQYAEQLRQRAFCANRTLGHCPSPDLPACLAGCNPVARLESVLASGGEMTQFASDLVHYAASHPVIIARVRQCEGRTANATNCTRQEYEMNQTCEGAEAFLGRPHTAHAWDKVLACETGHLRTTVEVLMTILHSAPLLVMCLLLLAFLSYWGPFSLCCDSREPGGLAHKFKHH